MMETHKMVRDLTFFSAILLLLALPMPSHASRAGGTNPVVLTIGTDGANLKYDKETLNARVGQKVRVTFSNNAPEDSGLQQNWVLIRPGTEKAVTEAALAAGPDQGFVPASPDVIAHTKMTKPGEKSEVVFDAPKEPGKYPFLCTFPGHSTTMKGLLVVGLH